MPYLHLPEHHSTDDLVLAGQIAEAFESDHLYVTWSSVDGAGTPPTVRAVVRDAPPHPLVEAFAMLFAALGGALRSLRRRPGDDPRVEPSREHQAA